MALAVIQFKGTKADDYQFKADIGTNTFFQYQIGGRQRKQRGVPILEDVAYRSPVFELNRNQQQQLNTNFLLEVPQRLFGQNRQAIQLSSFKDRQGRAKALSEIVRVTAGLPNGRKPFSLSHSMNVETNDMEPIPVKNKKFCYREPGMSQGMFLGLDTIVKALPGLGSVIGSLIPGGGGPSGIAGILGDPGKIVQAISSLVQKVAGPAPSPPPPQLQALPQIQPPVQTQPPVQAQPPAQAQPPVQTQPPAQAQNGQPSFNQRQVGAMSAQVEPTVWEALIPLLKKIVSPESLESIGDDPEKLLQLIVDALQKAKPKKQASVVEDEIAKSQSMQNNYSVAKAIPLMAMLPVLAPLVQDLLGMGLKKTQEQNRHLEGLNPGIDVDNFMIERLLTSMSLSDPAIQKIAFKPNPKLDLDFVQIKKVQLHGKSKVVYKKQDDLYFPIKISSKAPDVPKKPIPKVIVQLVVQDGESLKVLVEKKFKLKNISIGTTLENIFLSQEEAKNLPANKELKIEVSFIWKGLKTKQNYGTFKNHYITLIDDFVFDRIGDKIGEPVAFNDLVKHRPFWHKMWEGGYDKGRRWNMDLEVKYYYALDIKEEAISRLETRKLIQEDNADQEAEPNRRRVSAKLKSGMELSLEALNKLLPDLSKLALSEAKLKALKSPELQKNFNLVARANLEMKGKSGETGTIWTYPEICLYKLHLVGAAEVNDLGQVVQLKEEIVAFPRPSTIHFIGTKTA